MNLLLDTNVWLWSLYEPHKLAAERAAWLSDPSNRIVFSAISVWEFTIKRKIGKLLLQGDPAEVSLSVGFEDLPFTFRHGLLVEDLPLHHHDPFDRALLAQAKAEELAFLTSDRALMAYEGDVNVILLV